MLVKFTAGVAHSIIAAPAPKESRSLQPKSRLKRQLAEQAEELEILKKATELFKVTTDRNHGLLVAPNLLVRDFSAQHSNEKWVTDITYIQITEGSLYLAVMIDLYSRKIVGWSMSKNIDSQLVCDALMMALWRRKFPQSVLFTATEVVTICSHAFRDLLKKIFFDTKYVSQG